MSSRLTPDISNMDANHANIIGPFLASLSDKQYATMMSNEGLKIDDLAEKQRQVIQDVVRYNWAHKWIADISLTLGDFNALGRQDTCFRFNAMKELSSHPLFGYETTILRAGQFRRLFAVLCYPEFIRTSHGSTAITTIGDSPLNLAVKLDETKPKADDYNTDGTAINPYVESNDRVTINDLTERLNHSNNAEKYFVDEMYTRKTVVVIGNQKGEDKAILDAAVKAYGLRLRHADKETFIVTKPLKSVAQSPDDLKFQIKNCFPDDFLRLMEPSAYSPAPISPLPNSGVNNFPLHTTSLLKRKQQIRSAALHRLRILTEPKILASKEGKIYYNELAPEAQSLFNLVLMLDSFDAFDHFVNSSVPSYVAGLDGAVLRGRNSGEGTRGFPVVAEIWRKRANNKFDGQTLGYSPARQ